MTIKLEKILLPLEVCEEIFKYEDDPDKLIYLHATGSPHLKHTLRISNYELAQALVIGYEPQLTPEQRVQKNFFEPPITLSVCSVEMAYRAGMIDFAKEYHMDYGWMYEVKE